jgi:antitoxin component YwqK of YwqJK toxin-antitoxin module
MKTLFLLTILLLSLISTSCWGVDWDDLVEREGLYYKKFTETPFTGKVSGNEKGRLKNGIKEGKWFSYWDYNGALYQKGRYKNGAKEGEWVQYYGFGQLDSKGSYKNGEKEGEWVVYWGTNGSLASKENYKNGKREGESVSYYEDGQLETLSNFRDGKREGRSFWYNKNRSFRTEWTGNFKNGNKVSDYIDERWLQEWKEKR